MSTTRTPGITIGANGRFFIDKRYRGVRIGMRIGSVTQEHAEERLQTEMQHVDHELSRRSPRPRFADCAQRYLLQSKDMRSLEAIGVHVRLLVEHLGHLEPHQVHDATLAPFVSAHRCSSERDDHQSKPRSRAHDFAPRRAFVPR